MRKWLQSNLQAALGSKDDANKTEQEQVKKREENVDRALLDLIEKRRGAPESRSNSTWRSRSSSKEQINDDQLHADFALHNLACRASDVSESPFGTHASRTPKLGNRHFDCEPTDVESPADAMFTKGKTLQKSAAIEQPHWVCGICGQREIIGESCPVCYRPRGSSLNRSYMTVNELTEDIYEGLKRQRDYHGDGKLPAKARTQGDWQRTPASSQLHRGGHARTQVHWQDQSCGIGLTQEPLSRIPFSGSTKKSATFSGAARSTGSSSASSFKPAGAAPPLPSFSSLPTETAGPPLPPACQRMQRSSSTPGAVVSAPAVEVSTKSQFVREQQSHTHASTQHVHGTMAASPPAYGTAAMPPSPLAAAMRGARQPAAVPAAALSSGDRSTPSASTSAPAARNCQGNRSPLGTPPSVKAGDAVSVKGLANTQSRNSRTSSPAGSPSRSFSSGRGIANAGTSVVGPPPLPMSFTGKALDHSSMATSTMLNSMASSVQQLQGEISRGVRGADHNSIGQLPPGFKEKSPELSRGFREKSPEMPKGMPVAGPSSNGSIASAAAPKIRKPSHGERLAPLDWSSYRQPATVENVQRSSDQKQARHLSRGQESSSIPQHIAAPVRPELPPAAAPPAPMQEYRSPPEHLPAPANRRKDPPKQSMPAHPTSIKARQPPAGATSDDPDPMAMLMAQMQNLDRMKGRMQSSFA